MTYDPQTHDRRSMRFPEYDYSLPANYHVVLCTRNKQKIFGAVVNFEMSLSKAGKVAESCLQALPSRFPNVLIDVQAIMPDHIHILFELRGGVSLIQVVRAYKTTTAKLVAQQCGLREIWQRSFFDHIVRNERDLEMQRRYIVGNAEQLGADQIELGEWHDWLVRTGLQSNARAGLASATQPLAPPLL